MTLNKVFSKEFDEKIRKRNGFFLFLLLNEFRLNDFRWLQQELNEPEHFRLLLSNKLNDCQSLTIENPPTTKLETVFDRPNETSEEKCQRFFFSLEFFFYFGFVDVKSFRTLFSKVLILMWPSEKKFSVCVFFLSTKRTWSKPILYPNSIPTETNVFFDRWSRPKW